MKGPFETHECSYCGAEFSSAYLRNVHEADEHAEDER